MQSLHELTRIRHNDWAFKGAFFGSNPVAKERRERRTGEHLPDPIRLATAKAIGMKGISAEAAASTAKGCPESELVLGGVTASALFLYLSAESFVSSKQCAGCCRHRS